MEESGRRGRRRKEVNVESDGLTDQGSGAQDATGDQVAQRELSIQRELRIHRDIVRGCAVILTLLCALLAMRTTEMALHYNSDNNQNCNDRIWEEDQLMTNLTLEKDHLEARYKNLTLEKDRLETRYEKMTLERDQLQHDINQLKKETAVTPCSNGWKKFGCSFYCKSTGWKTWDESRDQCRKTRADLVVIDSKEEQEFIGGLTRGRGSWIGLKRSNDKWTWVAGTALTTQYWASGMPLNYRNWDCAYLHEDGGWHNKQCSSTQDAKTLICEK